MGPKAWNEITSECNISGDDPATIKCLEAVFANALSALVGLVGIALFIMIMYGGFLYLTAGADTKQTEKGRQAIFWAIIGIVVMICSYFILQAIGWLTGIEDITIFRIPTF